MSVANYQETRWKTHELYDARNGAGATGPCYEVKVRALELALAPGLSEEDIVSRAKAFMAFLAK